MAFEWRHNTAPTDISATLVQFGKVNASFVFTRWRQCVPRFMAFDWQCSAAAAHISTALVQFGKVS